VQALASQFTDLLSGAHAAPCLSLYQPTFRSFPEKRQDPIRFKNLLGTLHDALRQHYPQHAQEALLQPFHALAEDPDFWNHTLDGLAVLANRELFRVYRLQRPTPERAVVADSFHIKPLIRILQSADRYQLLALTQRSARLFEGNRDAVDEIPLAAGVPRTIEDALGEELTEPFLTASSRGSGGAPIYHGHGSRKDEQKTDTERFFRAVDRAVWQWHSRPSGLPLILAALPEHHATFRHVSHNPQLAAETIDVNPDTLDATALRRLGWEAEQPRYLALTAQLTERFHSARSKGLASDELTQVAAAASASRVATLMVDADQYVPGRLEPETGTLRATQTPDMDDLLDDLAELVLRRGGEAVVIPRERMPASTGLAALYRY
jgi:Bacterial archaeo-eukaryotic release factor family 3